MIMHAIIFYFGKFPVIHYFSCLSFIFGIALAIIDCSQKMDILASKFQGFFWQFFALEKITVVSLGPRVFFCFFSGFLLSVFHCLYIKVDSGVLPHNRCGGMMRKTFLRAKTCSASFSR